jgi:OOP family OmpA-OmpF porin
MTMNRKYVLSALAMVAIFGNAAVQAEERAGFYVGMGLGVATNKVGAFDADGIAVKVSAGYTFNPYFAAEAAYIEAGTLEDTVDGTKIETDSDGSFVAALGKIPLNDAFSLFAKLGYTFYDQEASASRDGLTLSEKSSGEDPLYGVGMDLRLGRTFQLRAEYEIVDVEAADFDFYSASAVFRF